MSNLIYLYAPVGERIGTYCPDTGRAQIGDKFLAVERVCRNVCESKYNDEFICSECGLWLDLYGNGCGYGSTMAFFEGRKVARELDAPNYCPNCGAKVVE